MITKKTRSCQPQRPALGLFSLLVCVCLLFGTVRGADAGHSRDPKAVEVARAMMQAMGGEDGWNFAHFVRFDFKVIEGGKTVLDRSHLWDKQTGRYRLEEKTKAGKAQVVLFNVGDKQGSVYLDGRKVEGTQATKLLEDAYGAFINDIYWLAMPWKWLDSGVNLRYLGTKTRRNETCDVVELTFDHVGLTPGDKYHAFVSQKSHLMTHWEYVLQDGEKGAWDWKYGDFGRIKLASDHTSADRKTSINMGKLRILESAEEAFFTDPSHTLSSMN